MKKLLSLLILWLGTSSLLLAQTLTVSANVSVSESAGVATFTVTLSPSSGSTVTVNYATAASSATSPSDFTTTSGTLTFLAGETSKTVDVPIVNDFLFESSETFNFTISAASGATIGTATRSGTIANDDPYLSSVNVRANENAGSAVVTVTMSAAQSYNVSIDFATSNSTAVAGSDYTATSGTVSFAPGITTQTISVTVLNDFLFEGDAFTMNFSNARNTDASMPMTITTSSVTVTIDNDDPLFTIVTNTFVSENAGNAIVTVHMSSAQSYNVSVDFNTSNSTAIAGSDYTATSGTISFAPGTTDQTISVPLLDDYLSDTEEFFVYISNARNTDASMPMTLAGGVYGTVYINNDDPYFFINNVVVNENAGNAVFTISLSAVQTYDAAINYATSNDTAIQPADYTATSGSLTIVAGTTTGTLSVPIIHDNNNSESNETFYVNLSNARKVVGNNPMSPVGFGRGIIVNVAPLPVSLVSFSIKKEEIGVKLYWQTASEDNNSHFDIQRGVNALSYETIGRIAGKGTTQQLNAYEYVDAYADGFLGGTTLYYRLVQVDTDGMQHPSRTLAYRVENEIDTLRIFPNPFADKLLIWGLKADQPISIEVIGSAGEVMRSYNQVAADANQAYILSGYESLPSGLYILQLQLKQDNAIIRKKLIKE